MRFKEIHEGIRMGGRELSQPTKKNYTIGFEFEVTVDSGFDANDDDDDDDEYDEDYNNGYDEAYENFSERWYGGESTFDFNEWFTQFIKDYNGGIIKVVEEYNYEPK